MKRDNQNETTGQISLPRPSSSDLRGRQSVRATFRLTEDAINTLSILSIQLGIKQKSLFDHLLEDDESLDLIAREIESEIFNPPNRVQKTYVLSKRTLACLERISRSYRTPRDALVEYSIRRLLPLINREREKHQKRKEILVKLGEFLKEGEKILKDSREYLGEEDPVHDRLLTAMNILANTYDHIESFIEKGKLLEEF